MLTSVCWEQRPEGNSPIVGQRAQRKGEPFRLAGEKRAHLLVGPQRGVQSSVPSGCCSSGVVFLACFASYLAGTVVLVLMSAPWQLWGLMALHLPMTGVLALLTRAWKVSIHAMVIAGLGSTGVVFFGPHGLPALALTGANLMAGALALTLLPRLRVAKSRAIATLGQMLPLLVFYLFYRECAVVLNQPGVSWHDLSIQAVDRALVGPGPQAVAAMGEWFALGYMPYVPVLVRTSAPGSPARRRWPFARLWRVSPYGRRPNGQSALRTACGSRPERPSKWGGKETLRNVRSRSPASSRSPRSSRRGVRQSDRTHAHSRRHGEPGRALRPGRCIQVARGRF